MRSVAINFLSLPCSSVTANLLDAVWVQLPDWVFWRPHPSDMDKQARNKTCKIMIMIMIIIIIIIRGNCMGVYVGL
jgi:hypothetical protein